LGTTTPGFVEGVTSRAMRKLSHGDGILLVVGFADLLGNIGIALASTWMVDIRFLLKLP